MRPAFRSALLATILAWVAVATPAHAACNAIPFDQRLYPSARGSVDRALIVPDEDVTIELPAACISPPLFDPTGNTVTLEFTGEPPDPGEPPVANTKVQFTNVSAVCTAGGCRKLTFNPASNVLDPGLPGDHLGPAGSLKIVVTNAAGEVATIERLYEPTSACNAVQNATIPWLTMLPPANKWSDIANGTNAPLLMALDHDGNLLVPLIHFTNDPPAKGFAFYQHGAGRFCAHKSSNPFCQTISAAIAGAQDEPPAIRAFTPKGHPLAPLLGHDEEGSLFGLVDAPSSVLRIERTSAAPGSAPRFDLGQYREDGDGTYNPHGPVTVARGLRPRFWGLRCAKDAGLSGLRDTSQLLVWVDDRAVVQTQRRAVAGKDCATSTRETASNVDLGNQAHEPAIEARSELAAFLAAGATPTETPTLSVYLAGPNGIRKRTPKQSRAASTARAVNRYPIAIEGEDETTRKVYFREEPDTLTTFDPNVTPNTDAFMAIGSASRAAVWNDRVIGLDPKTGNAWVAASGAPAQDLPGVTGTLVANGGDLVAVATQLPGGVTVWRWPATGLPGTGSATGMIADDLGTVRACDRGKCVTRVVLVTPEKAQGKDLNGDGDTNDRVLQFYDDDTQTVVSTRSAVAGVPEDDVVMAGGMVVFRVPEKDQTSGGIDLNNDGDKTDEVLHVLVFRPADTTGPRWKVLNTGYAARGEDGPWPTLGWRTPYRVVRDNVFFITPEDRLQDFIVQSADVKPLAPVQSPIVLLDAPRIQVAGLGLAIGDADGDAVLDPVDNCQGRPNPRQVDDDHDGLGDDVSVGEPCDPSYCSGDVPALVRLASGPVGDASLAYLRARGAATVACLGTLSARVRGEDEADRLCRGSFVASVENPPWMDGWEGRKDDPAIGDGSPARSGKVPACRNRHPAGREAAQVQDAFRRASERETALLNLLRGHERTPEQERKARDAVRTLGESIIAVTRAPYGRLCPALRPDREERAEAARDGVAALVDDFRAALVHPARPGTLDDPPQSACLRCLNRRNAARALESLAAALGPTERPKLDRPRRRS